MRTIVAGYPLGGKSDLLVPSSGAAQPASSRGRTSLDTIGGNRIFFPVVLAKSRALPKHPKLTHQSPRHNRRTPAPEKTVFISRCRSGQDDCGFAPTLEETNDRPGQKGIISG